MIREVPETEYKQHLWVINWGDDEN
jgi:hypothetical protein